MILYFADRKMNIVGTAFSNKGDGYICYSDKETSEKDTGTVIFTAYITYPDGAREEALNKIKSGNYLFVAGKDNDDAKFYTIVEAESQTVDRSIYIYAEDAGLDLLNNLVNAYETNESNIQPMSFYMDAVLNCGTDFEKGEWETPYSEVLNDEPKFALSFEEQTAKERLLKICEAFEVEPFFTFKIEGMTVTHKYINIKRKRGENNHVHLIVGREVENIRVNETVENLATAYKATGSKPEGNIGIKTVKENEYARQRYAWLKFLVEEDDNIVMSDSTSNAKFICISDPDKVDPEESDYLSDYHIRRFNYDGVYLIKPGSSGSAEFPEEGDDKTYYTWIKFSPNENGTNMTDGFTYGTSKYIGIATRKDKATKSTTPNDYSWTDISYADGKFQVVILSGTGAGTLKELDMNTNTVVTSNVWVKFSKNANGSGMTDAPAADTKYVGLCFERGSTESTTASDYEWVELEEATKDGAYVKTKADVSRGVKRVNSFMHYRFANDENGNEISSKPSSYIGIRLNQPYPTPMSYNPSLYTWTSVSGADVDKIDLMGIEYDDGDFYLDRGILKSREALDKWGRFVTNENRSGHIVRAFNYETTVPQTLIEKAIESLKKDREPKITYEVELNRLPKEGLGIGDTVYITDPEGGVYLESRVLKLEKSYCNDEITATFGDYKRLDNDISEQLKNLKAQVAEQIQNMATYTWVVYADNASGQGMSINPDGKKWMGIASNRTSKTPDLTNPYLYSWTKFAKEELYTIYYYGISANSNTLPSEWTTGTIDATQAQPYLWSKGVKHFDDGSTEDILPHIVGIYGKNGTNGKDGRGITSVKTYYQLSNSSSSAPTGTWVESPVPVITSTKRYLWAYDEITYTSGDPDTTTPRVIGAYGEDGTTIVSDITYYKTTTTSTAPKKTDPGWVTSPVPVITPTNKYLWSYEVIQYSDESVKEVDVHCIGVYGEKGTDGANGKDGKDGTNGANAVTYMVTASYAAIVKTKSGAYNPTSVTFAGKQQTGSGSPTQYGGRFKIETTADNSTWTSRYVSSVNEYSKVYSIPANIKAVRCSLYKAGGTTTLLDQQIVPVVTDGTDGANGKDGKNGVGINSTTTSYATSTTKVSDPSTLSWQSTIPTVSEGQYLWTRVVTDYTDSSVADTVQYTYSYQGKTGSAGTSVKVSKIEYQAGTSATTAPTGTWSSSVVSVPEGQYLWTKTTFSDGKIAYGVAKQGKSGTNGTNGKDAYTIILTNESHAFPAGTSAAIAGSTSCSVIAYKGTTQITPEITSVSHAGNTWPTGMSASIASDKKSFTVSVTASMKTKSGTITVDVKADGKTFQKIFSYTLAFTGSKGDKGDKGAKGDTGKGIKSSKMQYYLSSSDSSQTGGSWKNAPDEYRYGYYYWTRIVTTWTDDSVTYGDPILDMGMTTSNLNAWSAKSTSDGKNTIFYQTTQPSTSGRKSGDLWFDTDNDNKMHRFNGSTWVEFVLGDNALDELSANKITAGTLDASKVVVSNIDAGQITTGTMIANHIKGGTLDASEVAITNLNASNIKSGTLKSIDISGSNLYFVPPGEDYKTTENGSHMGLFTEEYIDWSSYLNGSPQKKDYIGASTYGNGSDTSHASFYTSYFYTYGKMHDAYAQTRVKLALVDYNTMFEESKDIANIELNRSGLYLRHGSNSRLFMDNSGTTISKGTFTAKNIVLIGASKTSYNDANAGVYISPNGIMHLSHGSAGSTINFHYNKSTSTTAYISEATSGTLKLYSNVWVHGSLVTGNTNGKTTYNDGKEGVYLGYGGAIHLTSATNPTLYFYSENATAATATLAAYPKNSNTVWRKDNPGIWISGSLSASGGVFWNGNFPCAFSRKGSDNIYHTVSFIWDADKGKMKLQVDGSVLGYISVTSS